MKQDNAHDVTCRQDAAAPCKLTTAMQRPALPARPTSWVMEDFMTVLNVAVIGGGNIGASLAYDCALRDCRVVIVEKDAETCMQSRERVSGIAAHGRLFSPLAKHRTPAQVLESICWTDDIEAVAGCSLVVENIPEELQLKEPLYGRLGEVLHPEAVLAANTSCIPITHLGACSGRPENVIGVHFMNPVYMKGTVEVIVGLRTSEQTRMRCLERLAQLGKQAVIVNDGPGFVSNRISHLFMNEAAFTVHDGVAGAAEVDTIFKQCFGHRMGPLETADLIGIDTVVKSLDVLYAMFQDSKYRVCPLMRRMAEAGFHGRKSGKGFYTYE